MKFNSQEFLNRVKKTCAHRARVFERKLILNHRDCHNLYAFSLVSQSHTIKLGCKKSPDPSYNTNENFAGVLFKIKLK